MRSSGPDPDDSSVERDGYGQPMTMQLLHILSYTWNAYPSRPESGAGCIKPQAHYPFLPSALVIVSSLRTIYFQCLKSFYHLLQYIGFSCNFGKCEAERVRRLRRQRGAVPCDSRWGYIRVWRLLVDEGVSMEQVIIEYVGNLMSTINAYLLEFVNKFLWLENKYM